MFIEARPSQPRVAAYLSESVLFKAMYVSSSNGLERIALPDYIETQPLHVLSQRRARIPAPSPSAWSLAPALAPEVIVNHVVPGPTFSHRPFLAGMHTGFRPAPR